MAVGQPRYPSPPKTKILTVVLLRDNQHLQVEIVAAATQNHLETISSSLAPSRSEFGSAGPAMSFVLFHTLPFDLTRISGGSPEVPEVIKNAKCGAHILLLRELNCTTTGLNATKAPGGDRLPPPTRSP
jgi:hypothetical protein